ncbi:dihydrolipoamide dehydrogenase [Paucimonas lemoignei]|uniref:Dihydrolipoyl dehydrogenase n=1 Tax=Paucimonas lemoignei TaxID=29443 RepID=A0A4R3HTZ4_PAULE|nr:dihydrolipoyl dehydrogenase [Paucimonas lemoignei]TCS36562.1 dihydrolipoamide dehydrogenase [Paucimonas lemoignei]
MNQRVDLNVDLVVIGGGPGGYTAAFRAADLGMSVALVEKRNVLGGVCLNAGCIPSKALLQAAKLLDEAAEWHERGIELGKPAINLDRLRGWKDSVVSRLAGGLSGLANKRGVKVISGEGVFAGPNVLEVSGQGSVRFNKAIIAVGSRPVRLPFLPDHPGIMDSTSALALEEVPKRLLVLGGGVIGLEMASIYASLGAEVSVVELTEGLLPGCDRDLVRPLEKRLGSRLKAIMTGTRVKAVETLKEGFKVVFEGAKAPAPQVYDRILSAAGRRPNGDVLHAEKAGINVDAQGFIKVDSAQRTNVPHIFAIGDVVGNPMLAHKASYEAKIAAEVASGMHVTNSAKAIPSVVYTDPEVAWVGLNETAAKRDGIPFEKATFPWMASGRSLTMGRDEGVTKILVDPVTRALLGVGIVGPHAGDLIAEATLAIETGCEPGDVGLTIHPHPSLSETFAFAAEAYEGTLTELYIPKKG